MDQRAWTFDLYGYLCRSKRKDGLYWAVGAIFRIMSLNGKLDSVVFFGHGFGGGGQLVLDLAANHQEIAPALLGPPHEFVNVPSAFWDAIGEFVAYWGLFGRREGRRTSQVSRERCHGGRGPRILSARQC